MISATQKNNAHLSVLRFLTIPSDNSGSWCSQFFKALQRKWVWENFSEVTERKENVNRLTKHWQRQGNGISVLSSFLNKYIDSFGSCLTLATLITGVLFVDVDIRLLFSIKNPKTMGWQLGKFSCLENIGGHGPWTGSAGFFFQRGHMAKVHGQLDSPTMKEKLVLWATAAAYHWICE